MSGEEQGGPHTESAPVNPPKPRNKGGRPKGSRNAVNRRIEQLGPDLENGSVREIIFGCFDALGGFPWLVRWAQKNPDKFLQLWAKMGPRSTPGRRVAEPRRDSPASSGGIEIQDFTDGE